LDTRISLVEIGTQQFLWQRHLRNASNIIAIELSRAQN